MDLSSRARKTDHVNWLAAVDALAAPTPPSGPTGLTDQQRRIVTAAVTLGWFAEHLLWAIVDDNGPSWPDGNDLPFVYSDVDIAPDLCEHPHGLRVDDDLRSASLFGHPLEVRVGDDAKVRNQLRAALTALVPRQALAFGTAFASVMLGIPWVGRAGPIITKVCVTHSASGLLRTARVASRLTRSVMADAAGVAPHTIRHWETRLPRSVTAHALAAAASVPTRTAQLAMDGIRDDHWPRVTPRPVSVGDLDGLVAIRPVWV